MGNEVELARLALWSDFWKMVIPALASGLMTYWLAKLEYKRRLVALEKEQKFNASELLFSFRKEQYNDLREWSKTFASTIGKLFGNILGIKASGDDVPEDMLMMTDALIDETVRSLSRTIHKMTTQHSDSIHFPEYKDQLDHYHKGFGKMLEIKSGFTIGQLIADFSFVNEAFDCLTDFASKIYEDELTATVNKYLE